MTVRLESVSLSRVIACAQKINDTMSTPAVEAFSPVEIAHALGLLTGTFYGLGLMVIEPSTPLAEALPLFNEGYSRGFELSSTNNIVESPASGRAS